MEQGKNRDLEAGTKDGLCRGHGRVEREAVLRCPHKQTCTQRRLELQKHKLKGEQRDEEEAESNHDGQTESCSGTLWEADRQSQETPQGGREELHT